LVYLEANVKFQLENAAGVNGDAGDDSAAPGRALRVNRLSLHDQIVQTIREMILMGELPPGSVISESALCASLGVSRTPLREALKVLASENLVQLRPHRTPLVSNVNPEEVTELFELLSIIEPAAGALACQRASNAEIDVLYQMHEQLTAFYNARERMRYFSANQAIHYEIVRLAGNKAMLTTYDALQSRVLRARSVANLSLERWTESVAEHAALIRAFCDRDDAGVSRLLCAHLQETSVAVLRSLHAAEEKPVL
jgi:DNA-binding GntR family transcriptional regulator